MCSAVSRITLPEPPGELRRLSKSLAAAIRARIGREGPIPFSDYMEMALYEPGQGYYSAGLQKFGLGGDFVTAPQLGDIFARCLARQVADIGEQLGEYQILEAGAGSGVLAADLLKALQHDRPPSAYRILERSAYLRQVQKETLAQAVPQWLDRISWLDQPPDAGWQGVFLANEVLDALTVERFCVEAGEIRRLYVDTLPDGFKWRRGDCPDDLQKRVERTLSTSGNSLPEAYCSEINPRLPDWLHAVTGSLKNGLALVIDYGYTRREYYLPERRDGTLICHYRHRAHDDPFLWPGLTDISASVDFTALAEAADYCGLEVSGYTSQAMFLLACGLEDVLVKSQDLPDVERLAINAQVRRLTLPGEMGERFQVMALGRGISCELRGFSLSDQRRRL